MEFTAPTGQTEAAYPVSLSRTFCSGREGRWVPTQMFWVTERLPLPDETWLIYVLLLGRIFLLDSPHFQQRPLASHLAYAFESLGPWVVT